MSTAPQEPEEPELIPADVLFEEERLPNYTPERFYPVRIGEVLNSRYRVICKLGWGAGSTVWLAKDLNASPGHIEYVALKVCANDGMSEHERESLKYIASVDPDHPALNFIRLLHDTFDIETQHGTHACLVFIPLREPLNVLQKRMQGGRFPFIVVRIYMKILLIVLCYLHDDCNVVHTVHIKPENVLVGFESTFDFSKVEEEERQSPPPRKVLPDRTIYMSRSEFEWTTASIGKPKLTDFDLALPISDEQWFYTHSIQIVPYRAPEVIMGQKWGFAVDIWSLGVMSWEMLEGKPLCSGLDEDGKFSLERKIAQLVGLFGAPSEGFGLSGNNRGQFFDEHGKLLPSIQALVPSTTLEELSAHVDEEEKGEFLRFMRRLLQIDPVDRATASELLEDPFMVATDVD